MTRRKTEQYREFRCTSQCIDRQLNEQFCCATAVQSDGGLPIRDKSAMALLPSDQTLHVPKFQCVGYLTGKRRCWKKAFDVAYDCLCAHPDSRVLTADLRTDDAS